MDTPTGAGARIRQLREGKGLSQSELAAAAGIVQSTLSRIEFSGQGRVASLNRIAQVLEVTLDDLLREGAAA